MADFVKLLARLATAEKTLKGLRNDFAQLKEAASVTQAAVKELTDKLQASAPAQALRARRGKAAAQPGDDSPPVAATEQPAPDTQAPSDGSNG